MTVDGRERFNKIQRTEEEMLSRLNTIQTATDFRKYIEEYIDSLAGYRQLSNLTVDDYLFVIAGFADSPAGLREIGHGEPLWRSVAKVLIYALDRE